MSAAYNKVEDSVPAAAETSGRERDRAEFQQHIHLFRGVAIILIILLHCIPSFDWSQRPLTSTVLETLLRQSSMLFFFISGYLFQHLSGRFEYRRYLKRKWQTIIIPYFIVSIPALIISTEFIPQDDLWPWFYDLPLWQQLGLFLLTGKHLEPLWFVPTIALFYLVSPLFIALDRAPKFYWVLIPLLSLAMILGPNGPTGPLQKAIYLLPSYLFGMLVSHYREKAEALAQAYIWSLSAALCLLFVILAATLDHEEPVDLFIAFKLLSCLPLLLLLKRFGDRLPTALGQVATLSFGIYFVHGYLIAGFRLVDTVVLGGHWEGKSELFPASLIGLVLHALIVLLASVAVVLAVKKLFPAHSRQIVGA